MRYFHHGRFQQQFKFLRHQFLQDGDLPFCNILSEQTVSQALTAIETRFLDRIFPPLVTWWVFLGQVLSQYHSCRAAVARLIAHRISRKQQACSAETGAYCMARKRLPESFFSDVARQTGSALDTNAKEQWLWKGRHVLKNDGSTVSMPDTPEHQEAYPQPPQQKPGVGSPLARIAAFFSFACGAVVELGICSNEGKGNSELGLLRKLWNILKPGDVLLTDRYMCAWTELVMLKQRGVDSVTRLHHLRRIDFRRGKHLGPGDHIIEWPKPRKPHSIDQETYDTLPDVLMVRETRVKVEQPGFRTMTIIVVTTLLDAEDTPGTIWQICISRAGMRNLIFAPSNVRWEWISCVRKLRRWCVRNCGPVCSRIT